MPKLLNYLGEYFSDFLFKSTLASMAIYQMFLVRMPKVVALRLERLQRVFLWGGGALERNPHLIRWDVLWSA